MINFYKNNGGVGTIQFASGEVVTLSDDVSIRADNTTNLIIISEFNKDKFWISTAGPLQVNGAAITGTNQQKVDLIAPVFAQVAQSTGVVVVGAQGLSVYCMDCTADDGQPGVLEYFRGTTWKNAW